MASDDINSLFTNALLDESFRELYTHYHAFSTSQLCNLLSLSVKNCHFLLNNCLYEQVDGIAMGSPQGPLFANIFLSFHEHTWLANCPREFMPFFIRRYIDDFLLSFVPVSTFNPSKTTLIHNTQSFPVLVSSRITLKFSFLDILINR